MAVLGCAEEAVHQPGDDRVCREGTREGVLYKIELWAQEPNGPPIYWLTGPPQKGKSTIARTIAEKMIRNGSLGATFFCSRGRDQLLSIFPTLASQLAHKYPEFRSALKIAWPRYSSLKDQANNLIVQPLKKSAISTVIIIDALDECEVGERILYLLGLFAPEIPKVKFFVTSRKEQAFQSEVYLLGESKVQVSDLNHE